MNILGFTILPASEYSRMAGAAVEQAVEMVALQKKLADSESWCKLYHDGRENMAKMYRVAAMERDSTVNRREELARELKIVKDQLAGELKRVLGEKENAERELLGVRDQLRYWQDHYRIVTDCIRKYDDLPKRTACPYCGHGKATRKAVWRSIPAEHYASYSHGGYFVLHAKCHACGGEWDEQANDPKWEIYEKV